MHLLYSRYVVSLSVSYLHSSDQRYTFEFMPYNVNQYNSNFSFTNKLQQYIHAYLTFSYYYKLVMPK